MFPVYVDVALAIVALLAIGYLVYRLRYAPSPSPGAQHLLIMYQIGQVPSGQLAGNYGEGQAWACAYDALSDFETTVAPVLKTYDPNARVAALSDLTLTGGSAAAFTSDSQPSADSQNSCTACGDPSGDSTPNYAFESGGQNFPPSAGGGCARYLWVVSAMPPSDWLAQNLAPTGFMLYDQGPLAS